ncbi:MAG: serine/threonine protein kinase, partial [Phycisphaerales bacterium]|nr:serine/threonine protein kinase [Phycisphaerales bacterium]
MPEGPTEAQRSRIEEICQRLLDVPADRIEAALLEIAPDDAVVRREVAGILRYLERDVGEDASHRPEVPGRGELTGTTIADRYKVLGVLGEGGFGVVYEAEQVHPIRRRVAIKVLKPGMDSTAVLSRFETERQALGVMNHTGIACVHDAGRTERGLPYFVMELVKGEPITRFCDRHHLTIEERVRLMIRVCHGVQHAHMKGVIHRDLKPSNILVGYDHDGNAQPKIIDFGVAKATNRRLSEQ